VVQKLGLVTQRNKPLISNDPLVFKQATITISFGATKDVTAGAAGGLSLVTLTGTIESSKNAVQQMKLSFSPPPSKSVSAIKGLIKQ
jgi:membrane protease subunit (stomatin/prohibitin family)